jgi:hypothetical protein
MAAATATSAGLGMRRRRWRRSASATRPIATETKPVIVAVSEVGYERTHATIAERLPALIAELRAARD